MAALSGLNALVIPELPGCSTSVAAQAILQSAIDFCRDTSAWRGNLATISSVADQADYTLVSAEASGFIHQILQVDVGDVEEWTFTVDKRSDTITLDPAPSKDNEDIVIEAVYQPITGMTNFPDYLYDRYGRALAWGALANLKARRNFPWYDLQGARYYQARYKDEVDNALADEIVDGNNGSIVMGVEHVL